MPPSLFTVWLSTAALCRYRILSLAIPLAPTSTPGSPSPQKLPADSSGLVCQGHACSEPAQNFEQLEQQLRDRRGLIL